MNQESTLGYSKSSPFNRNGVNNIQANGITMERTARPLIAANKKGAALLTPGNKYSGIHGNTSEMPVEMLLELEPVLLERHLSTLKDKDKEVFTDKYQVLGTNMKVAALTQMLGKYPDVAQAAQQSFQNGGRTPAPLTPNSLWGLSDNLPLQSYYTAPQESTVQRPTPALPLSVQFSDPQAQIDAIANEMLADKTPYVRNAMDENYAQPIKSGSERKKTREKWEKEDGGKTDKYKRGGLTKAKAAEILHDGTVHGKPITDKQRKFFAATAYGKNKKMQDGGGWKYEAPPTEGFHLVGIESNRPQKGTLPPQGPGQGSAKNAPLRKQKLQDESTPEEEAFLAKQRAMNDSRMAQDAISYVWETPPENKSTVQGLQNPSWLQGSRPMQKPLSNTSSAIAAVSADPVWDQIMFTPTTRLRPQETYPPVRLLTEEALGAKPLQASVSDTYAKWKSYKDFGYPNKVLMDTDKMQVVKRYKNGDSLVSYYVHAPTDATKLVPMYMVRDGRSGKYAQVDPTNMAEIELLKKAD